MLDETEKTEKTEIAATAESQNEAAGATASAAESQGERTDADAGRNESAGGNPSRAPARAEGLKLWLRQFFLLVKYEIIASARAFLPLYATFLAVAVAASLNQLSDDARSHAFIETSLGLLLFGTICASIIITIAMISSRFKKTMLGDEGYLQHSIPAGTGCQLGAKFASAVLWLLAGELVAGIAFVFGEIIWDIAQNRAVDFALFIPDISDCLTMLSFIVACPLVLYLSHCVAHLLPKWKSVGLFAALILQFWFLNGVPLAIVSAVHIYRTNVAVNVLYSVLAFIACRYILKNKLNL